MTDVLIKNCRICESESLDPILDLGVQKIANGFHDKSHKQPEAPLALIRCTNCNLVQLSYSVDTDAMYREYWYKSGINKTMNDHLKGIYQEVMKRIKLEADDVIIDIGCNDGTFLSNFSNDFRKIGVDPSNIDSKDCIRVRDYFTYDNIKQHIGQKGAKLITSIAMFYDLNDPKSFVKDVRKSLRDDGIWALELSYLPRMIENAAYDSICHEHVTYYSVTTFLSVIKDTDLKITSLSFNEMNGGSFRMTLSPKAKDHCESVYATFASEQKKGYSGTDVYQKFVKEVNLSKQELIDFIKNNKHKKIFAAGASTKGQIILQYCGINSNDIIAIAERNPTKHGLYTPGSNILICSEDEMRVSNPDYLIIFPWYFFNEIKGREKDIYDLGCKFVLPLPKFTII